MAVAFDVKTRLEISSDRVSNFRFHLATYLRPLCCENEGIRGTPSSSSFQGDDYPSSGRGFEISLISVTFVPSTPVARGLINTFRSSFLFIGVVGTFIKGNQSSADKSYVIPYNTLSK